MDKPAPNVAERQDGRFRQGRPDRLRSICRVKKSRLNSILDDVIDAVKNWETYAETARVPENLAQGAMRGFRLYFSVVTTAR